MKALNNSDIYKKYWTFLIYFSILLFFTVLCRFLYFQAHDVYVKVLTSKKERIEFLISKRVELSKRVDSLNSYMHMLNTKQVKNDAALERDILRIKYDAMNDIETLEAEGVNEFSMYKKVLESVEMILDAKKTLNQALQEEEVSKKKLMECNQANAKLRDR